MQEPHRRRLRLRRGRAGEEAGGGHARFYYRGCKNAPTTGTLQALDVNCEPMSTDGGTGATFGILNWGMTVGGARLELFGAPEGLAEKVSDTPILAPTPDRWVHVHVDLAIGATGSAQVYYDCQKVFDRSGDTSCPGSHPRSVLLGMFTCTEVPDCSLYFDDIVVDVDQP